MGCYPQLLPSMVLNSHLINPSVKQKLCSPLGCLSGMHRFRARVFQDPRVCSHVCVCVCACAYVCVCVCVGCVNSYCSNVGMELIERQEVQANGAMVLREIQITQIECIALSRKFLLECKFLGHRDFVHCHIPLAQNTALVYSRC